MKLTKKSWRREFELVWLMELEGLLSSHWTRVRRQEKPVEIFRPDLQCNRGRGDFDYPTQPKFELHCSLYRGLILLLLVLLGFTCVSRKVTNSGSRVLVFTLHLIPFLNDPLSVIQWEEWMWKVPHSLQIHVLQSRFWNAMISPTNTSHKFADSE